METAVRCFAWIALASLAACTQLGDCGGPTLEPTECVPRRDDPFYVPYAAYEPVEDECGDPFEPNEDITQATIGTRWVCSTNDSPDARPIKGHVGDAWDVDVFRTGHCGRGALATANDPRIVVRSDFQTKKADSNDSDPYLRLCVFPMCHDGATNLQACSEERDGTTTRVDYTTENPPDHLWSTRLESGFTGCCRVGPGSLEVEFVCQYLSREVDTFFWVDTIDPATTCSEYELSYEIDP
jgi:hypothetical protein